METIVSSLADHWPQYVAGLFGLSVLTAAGVLALWAIEDVILDLGRRKVLSDRGSASGASRSMDRVALASTDQPSTGQPGDLALAILIPAWAERTGLTRTVAALCEDADYARFQIFIGSWPGDDTPEAVSYLEQRYPQVHIAAMTLPGSPAACVNRLTANAEEAGARLGFRFDGYLVLNPGEVLHPFALRLVSRALGEADIVRLPIFGADTHPLGFCSRYLRDQFAVSHLRELPVRSELGECVSGGGLALAFSDALLAGPALRTAASKAGSAMPLDISSVVPDYELQLRLQSISPIPGWARVTTLRGEEDKHEALYTAAVCIRRELPHRFTNAQRYRARRIAGVSHESLSYFRHALTHHHSLWHLFCLWRDMRTIPYAHVMAAGVLSAIVLVLWSLTTGAAAFSWVRHLAGGSTLLGALLLVGGVGFLSTLIQRTLAVARVYGGRRAVFTPLTTLGGLGFDYAAICRATALLWRGGAVEISLPKAAADTADAKLAESLGGLLTRRQVISPDQLDQALANQRTAEDPAHKRPLGRILVDRGTDERAVLDALSAQLSLPVRDFRAEDLTVRVAMRLPRSTMLQHRVFPIQINEDDVLEVACYRVPDDNALEQIRQEAGMPVAFCLSRRAPVRRALRMFELLCEAVNPRVLAASRETLGVLTLRVRRGTQRSRSAQYSRQQGLGEYLVAEGYIDRKTMRLCVEQAAHRAQSLGDYLINQGFLTEEVLDTAISRNRRLRGIRLATVHGRAVSGNSAGHSETSGESSGGLGNAR